MVEKWDGPSLLGGVVVAVIFGSLAITIGGGWPTIAGAEGQTWAAWFQGIGSVAAILVTNWLHVRGNREASQRAKNHAVVFRAGLTDLLLSGIRFARKGDTERLSDCSFVLREVINLGQSIQLERLDDILMLRVASWRTVSAQALSVLEQFNSLPRPVFYADTQRVISEFQDLLKTVEKD